MKRGSVSESSDTPMLNSASIDSAMPQVSDDSKELASPKAESLPEITPTSTVPGPVANVPDTSSLSKDPGDLVYLLSIKRSLYSVLDPEEAQLPAINDYFLIGYTMLMNQTYYPIFQSINHQLISFLNSKLSSTTESKLLDFKVCLIYAILAMGYKDENEDLHMKFLNKSWHILINQLIPRYSLEISYQIEILKNLFVLSFIYVRFKNNNVILNYLDDTSFIIFENLSANNRNYSYEENRDLHWNIYLLLSNYKINDSPPKCYRFFLDQVVPGQSLTLKEYMLNYSKSINFVETQFLNDVVILTLSNELNSLIYNNSLCIYELNNALHNSIILINKSINKDGYDQRHFDIFKVFKKKLIINSPVKFKEILGSYIFKIERKYHWNILITTLKEINLSFDFSSFINMSLNSNLHSFGVEFMKFFFHNMPVSLMDSNNQDDIISLFFQQINNNFGIVSFPVIFQSKLLKFEKDALEDFNAIEINQLINFLTEWYLTIVKILVNVIQLNSNETSENLVTGNYILQCLFYMLHDEDMNFEGLSNDWVWKIYHKTYSIYNHWLTYLNSKFDNQKYYVNFNLNLSVLVNQVFHHLINSEVNLGDLLVTPEGLVLRTDLAYKRSKSIGTIEHNLTSLSSTTSANSDNNGANYVLINKPTDKLASPPQMGLANQMTTFPQPSIPPPAAGYVSAKSPVYGTLVLPPIAPKDPLKPNLPTFK